LIIYVFDNVRGHPKKISNFSRVMRLFIPLVCMCEALLLSRQHVFPLFVDRVLKIAISRKRHAVLCRARPASKLW